jgi:hypothetical protein
MRSTSSQGELIKWLNRDLNQLKQFCAEYVIETFPAKSFEICLMAIYLQPKPIENCQDQDFWQVMKFI